MAFVLASSVEPIGLHSLDWGLIGVYALSTIVIGWYFGRQQKNTAEYYIGSGKMNPLLIGISLFATLLSTISYLSIPGETVSKGPVYVASLLSYPLIYLIVAYGMLPVYMRHRVTSAYELLELKLGLSIRLLGASMFLMLRLVWMSLLVYLAAEAMVVMMGIGDEWIPYVVLFTGLVAVTYTSVGGLRAVVVTDLLQTLLLFGGAVLVIVMVTVEMKGFGWIPTTWHPNWDTQPIISFDPQTRVTFVGSVLSLLVWYVCTTGGDQVSVQRFMATRDVSAARWAFATQLWAAALVTFTLLIVGVALLGYFEVHSAQLPQGMGLKESGDRIFPRYIAYHLPVGVSGLVVSAMFAAAMSSIDSGVNSITAVVTTDFLERFGVQPQSERGQLIFARCLAFVIGTIIVLGSSFMGYLPGNITAVTNKTSNLFAPSIFCLFFFALFVRFARPVGVWVGAICGTLTAFAIAFSGPWVTFLDQRFGIPARTFGVDLQRVVDPNTGIERFMAPDPISFQWIGLAALVVNVAVGTLISLAFARGQSHRKSNDKES